MKIVIIGAGKVGYKLAQQLSEEEYDVVLIDENAQKLRTAINRLDVNCAQGDGCSVEVQRSADVENASLVIACTSSDECNMLACLVAKRIGAKRTIARVRNPIYYQQIDVLQEDLHLSMAVNPELVVAREITRLILFPDASKVETFVEERVELIEFPILQGSSLIGMVVSDLCQRYQIQVLVCAVERGQEIFIPDGEYVMEQDDRIYITASHEEVSRFFRLFGYRKNKIKKVLICGGGDISYYLTKQLSQIGMEVKIVEKDEGRCHTLCEDLPKATIIHGDATDQDLLLEEGLEEADAFIALTGMDEENIITSLFAQGQGVSKIILKVNEDRRNQMLEELGLDSVVSAKSVTADVISSYVRAWKNSQRSANVETIYQLVNGRVEALEFVVKSKTRYTNIPLKNLALKPHNLIACIARNRDIIIPNGEDCIQVGDSVIIVTETKQIQDLEEILL